MNSRWGIVSLWQKKLLRVDCCCVNIPLPLPFWLIVLAWPFFSVEMKHRYYSALQSELLPTFFLSPHVEVLGRQGVCATKLSLVWSVGFACEKVKIWLCWIHRRNRTLPGCGSRHRMPWSSALGFSQLLFLLISIYCPASHLTRTCGCLREHAACFIDGAAGFDAADDEVRLPQHLGRQVCLDGGPLLRAAHAPARKRRTAKPSFAEEVVRHQSIPRALWYLLLLIVHPQKLSASNRATGKCNAPVSSLVLWSQQFLRS